MSAETEYGSYRGVELLFNADAHPDAERAEWVVVSRTEIRYEPAGPEGADDGTGS